MQLQDYVLKFFKCQLPSQINVIRKGSFQVEHAIGLITTSLDQSVAIIFFSVLTKSGKLL